jgi:tetratricopeptide (TPR) repeat protein
VKFIKANDDFIVAKCPNCGNIKHILKNTCFPSKEGFILNLPVSCECGCVYDTITNPNVKSGKNLNFITKILNIFAHKSINISSQEEKYNDKKGSNTSPNYSNTSKEINLNNLSNNAKLELAKILFDSLKLSVGFGNSNSQLNKIAEKILKEAKDRHKILDKIIELCKDIDDPKAYLIVGRAYVWKGAKFRKEAIKYLEKYLINPTEDSYEKGYVTRDGENVEITLEIHLFWVYSDLGECYEGVYDFDNALRCYKLANKMDPAMPSGYIRIAQIYTKLGQINEAIKLLEQAKKTPYYQPKKVKNVLDNSYHIDDSFKVVIDNSLKDFINKKEKGYVYRPRKIKHNIVE